MQKTFVSASVLIVTFVTLLSIRLQISQASAESLPDPALSLTPSVALEQSAPEYATTSASSTPSVTPPTASTHETLHKASQNQTKVATSQSASAKPAVKTIGTSAQYPERLIIPSLDINVPIVAVGVNAKGEMAVPSGHTNNVGWYKGGPMPGSVGSAVLDAHVFAAFKTLRYLKVGGDIYVQTRGGTKLHFVVEDSRVYTLSELTSNMLFGNTGKRRLNLITCAGTYIPSMGTYDHRLVDYALFLGEE